MWRKLTALGMLSTIAYAVHVVLGGILWKGYDHLMQPISDLTASGAPNRELLSNILILYGPPAIVFAFSALMYLRSFAPKVAQTGMFLYLLMQLVSLSYGYFPEDLPGGPATFTGTMHLVVTGLIIPLTILSPVLVGIGLRRLPDFKSFGTYSLITGFVVIIAGGTAGYFFANKLSYFGLAERINIGTIQLWMFLAALKFIKSPEVRNRLVFAPRLGKWD